MSLDNLTPAEFFRWFSLGQSVRRMMGKGEQWEVLFEGTRTTADRGNHPGASAYSYGLDKLITSPEGKYRLTVDGTTATISISAGHTSEIVIGNSYLWDGSNPDTGHDFCVYIRTLTGVSWDSFILVSRTAGTYNVKIERKVATMYSYNGVVLPKLPETDLPYAVIECVLSSNTYNLRFSATPFTHRKSALMAQPTNVLDQTDATLYQKKEGSDAWEYVSDGNSLGVALTGSPGTDTVFREVIWCNEDIITTNDSAVYLAASEPVPVYE